MIRKVITQFLKTVSLCLSALLIWQGIVWAHPQRLQVDTLQPRSFFGQKAAKDNFIPTIAKYISIALTKFESDINTRNLYGISEKTKDLLIQLENSGALPRHLMDHISGLKGSPQSGELYQDIGPLRIRYYNHRIPGTNTPGPGWREIKPQSLKIGEYLSRQILLREEIFQELEPHDLSLEIEPLDMMSRGYIAKGKASEIFEAFQEKNKKTTPLRRSLRKKMATIKSDIKVRVERSSIDPRFQTEIAERLSYLDMSPEKLFTEFRAVVLPGDGDTAQPKGWLLGFNSVNSLAGSQDGLNALIRSYLSGPYPEKIGLASEVLDILSRDMPLLSEYVFHELLCPVIGHANARKFQEILYPENYPMIIGRMDPGHRDGELALVFKKIILGSLPSQQTQPAAILSDPEIKEFMEYDFREDGPQKATRIFSDHEKRLKEIKSTLITTQSRLKGLADRRKTVLLSEAQNRYEYMKARLRWNYEMSSFWDEAIKIMKEKKLSGLTASESNALDEAIRNLLKAHEMFVKDLPEGRFITRDPTVIAALRTAAKTAGWRGPLPKTIAPGISTRENENKKTTSNDRDLSRKRPKTGSFKDIFKAIDWKRLAITVSMALALSMVLYFILPVNRLTLVVATILPLALMVIFLKMGILNWKSALVFAVIFTAFSILMPVRWFGLSLSIIILSRMAFSGQKKGAAAGAARLNDQKKRTAEEDGGETTPAAQTDEEKMNEEFLKNVHISKDVLYYMFKLIFLRFGDPGKQSGEKTPQKKHLDTLKVLDAVFMIDAPADTELPPGYEEKLREFVENKLDELDSSINYDIRKITEKLKNWENEEEDSLAEALNELSQEVSGDIGLSLSEEETIKDILAIQKLIGEYYGISNERLEAIRMKMVLLNMRDIVLSKTLLGKASAKDHYLLGRCEFYYMNFDQAEENFAEAVRLCGPEIEQSQKRKDYLLTLGIAQHYRHKLNEASDSYRASIEERTREQPGDDIQKLKIEMTDLLIKKCARGIGLDGKKIGSGFATSPYLFNNDLAPFTSAPVMEEIIKVGIPFGVLAVLSAFGVDVSIGRAVFFSLLAVSGAGFVAIHIPGRTYLEREKQLLIAPTTAATFGMIVSLIYISRPFLALSLSIAGHIIINLAVLGSHFLKQTETAFAALADRGSAEPAPDYPGDIEPRTYNKDLLQGEIEGYTDHAGGTGSLSERTDTEPLQFPVAENSIHKVAPEILASPLRRERPSTLPEVLANAETVVPKLVNSLICMSMKKNKTVLAIDSSMGKGDANALLSDLIKALPEMRNNNNELKRFLDNLVKIDGKGADLALRVNNITDNDRGGVRPDDVIVITTEANMALFSEKATIVGLDDSRLPESSYIPILEIILFAIAKHLGWSSEDLVLFYSLIPNVRDISDLDEQDIKELFVDDMRTFVIRLLQGEKAVKFEPGAINEKILYILSKA
jgi:hypothetical protein